MHIKNDKSIIIPTESIKVCSHAIRRILLPTVSDRPTISFTRILEFSNHTRACNAGTRNRIRLCMPCGKLRVHTKARVSHTRAGITCTQTRARSRAQVHIYTLGWYNTGKVACQTGIICNAAVVVVVGLNYIVTLPGCSSLFHSLSFPVSFSPAFSPSILFIPSFSRMFLRVFPLFFPPRHQRSTLWSFPWRRSNRVAVFHRWIPSRSKDKWTAIMWKEPNASTSKLRNGVPKFSKGKNVLPPPSR